MRNDPKTGPVNPGKVTRAEDRKSRLKTALKANMARRKAQGRAQVADEDAGASGQDKKD